MKHLLLIGLLGLGLLLALSVGATGAVPFVGDNPLNDLILFEIRLPRALAAALVGLALGGAGAVMQCITRNPLAGPGLFGLNGGSTLAVLLLLVNVPHASLPLLALVSLAGAAVATFLVLGLARLLPAGMSALGLTVCGAALAALFQAGAAAVVVATQMLNDMLYWTVGGIGTVDGSAVWLLLAGVGLAALLIVPLTPALTTLLLDDETATGLGQRVRRVRAVAAVAVVLAAGSATAVAGPVAFVGLLAPHAARPFFGHDQRRLIPAAALIGAIAVVLADVLARVVRPPSEVPLGVFISLVGAPLLALVVLRHRREAWG